MTEQQLKAPAGWFADPTGQAPERYWDGTGWTTRVRARGASDASIPPGSPLPSPAGLPDPPLLTPLDLSAMSEAHRRKLRRRPLSDSILIAALGIVSGVLTIALSSSAKPIWSLGGLLFGAGAAISGLVELSRANKLGGSKTLAVVGLSMAGLSMIIGGFSVFAAGADVAASKYDQAYFEQEIENGVKEQTGRDIDVACPDSVKDTSMNATFVCTATVDGEFGVFDVQFTDERGTFIWTVRN